jgi:hypothetical protein
MSESNMSGLSIFFSSTNQHGVVRNDIYRHAPKAGFSLSDFVAEVTAIFGGECLNVSNQIFRLTEAEKDSRLVIPIERRSRYAVGCTVWNSAQPKKTEGAYLAGIHSARGPEDIKNFLLAHAKMSNGDAVTNVRVGAPKFLE